MNNNSASYGKGLIANGNPTPLGIGDGTYIQPGTQNSLYKDLQDKYPTLPVDITVLVVDHASGLDGVKDKLPIVAFAGFRITDIVGGSGKYIRGTFHQRRL